MARPTPSAFKINFTENEDFRRARTEFYGPLSDNFFNDLQKEDEGNAYDYLLEKKKDAAYEAFQSQGGIGESLEEYKTRVAQALEEKYNLDDPAKKGNLYSDSEPEAQNKFKALKDKHLSDKSVYEDSKTDASKLDKLTRLMYFKLDTEKSGVYGDAKMEWKQDSRGNACLQFSNIGDSKLKFGIYNDSSLVLDNFSANPDEAKAHLRELKDFFAAHGINEISLPRDRRDLQDLYNQILAEDNNSSLTPEENSEAQSRQENTQRDGDGNPSVQEVALSRVKKDKKYSLNDMDKKMRGRATIAGGELPKNCKRSWTMDGWLEYAFYDTHEAARKDGKYDKNTGLYSHTCNCKIRMRYKNGRPEIKYYVPPGKTLDKGYAKAMLEAAKAGGATHAIMPFTKGASMGAWWDACGECLMVPDGDGGIRPSAKDVTAMLKAAQQEEKDKTAVAEWKKALAIQLKENMAMERKSNPNYKDSELSTKIAQLEGEAKYYKFKTSLDDDLLPFIDQQQYPYDANQKPWDAVDSLAAGYAYAQLIENFNSGGKEGEYNKLMNDPNHPKKMEEYYEKKDAYDRNPVGQEPKPPVHPLVGEFMKLMQAERIKVKKMVDEKMQSKEAGGKDLREDKALGEVRNAADGRIKAVFRRVNNDCLVELKSQPNLATANGVVRKDYNTPLYGHPNHSNPSSPTPTPARNGGGRP